MRYIIQQIVEINPNILSKYSVLVVNNSNFQPYLI